MNYFLDRRSIAGQALIILRNFNCFIWFQRVAHGRRTCYGPRLHICKLRLNFLRLLFLLRLWFLVWHISFSGDSAPRASCRSNAFTKFGIYFLLSRFHRLRTTFLRHLRDCCFYLIIFCLWSSHRNHFRSFLLIQRRLASNLGTLAVLSGTADGVTDPGVAFDVSVFCGDCALLFLDPASEFSCRSIIKDISILAPRIQAVHHYQFRQ